MPRCNKCNKWPVYAEQIDKNGNHIYECVASLSVTKEATEPTRWSCSICNAGPFPHWRRSCPKCFSQQGQVPTQINRRIVPWECVDCKHLSEGMSDSCASCYLPKGFWRCQVCTCVENVLSSPSCIACYNERGALINEVHIPIDVENATPVPLLKECRICCEGYIEAEMLNMGCCECCLNCSRQQLSTQIEEGRALQLKCCCRTSQLLYMHVRPLLPSLSIAIRELYTLALRRLSSGASLLTAQFYCPECQQDIWVTPNQPDTKCPNPRCFSTGTPICVKHRTLFRTIGQRYRADGTIMFEKACHECNAECNGDALLTSVMKSVQDAFCDRCPKCDGYVGIPENFQACLALRCNHCEGSFCGFCYKYAGSSMETHDHLTVCHWNPDPAPIKDMWVASETIWQNRMKQRRRGLGQAIIAASALSAENKIAALAKMEELLLMP